MLPVPSEVRLERAECFGPLVNKTSPLPMANQHRRLAVSALVLFTTILFFVTFRHHGNSKNPEQHLPIEQLVVGFNQTTAPPVVQTTSPPLRFQVEHLAWTTVKNSGKNLPQFLSAYFDDRVAAEERPAVVVLGYHPKTISKIKLYCSLTFSSLNTRCVETPVDKVILRGSSYVRNLRSDPVEYICKLNCQESGCSKEQVPTFVALSFSADCSNASDNIPVRNRSPVDKKSLLDFAVCVESPVYEKSSTQLAEFIEMQHVLGAQRITMYIMDLSEKLESFFVKKYSDNGLLEVIKWRKFERRAEMHYYGELLVMHDCLYRNMNRVKYLVFVDLDEVILPVQHSDWTSMIKKLDTSSVIGAFVFLNRYFTNDPHRTGPTKPCKELDVPVYFKWTKRYLCTYPRHRRSKFIAKPKLMRELDIHGVKPLSGHFEHTVSTAVAINAHYRYRMSKDCTNTTTVTDTTALKYQSKVMDALKQKICPIYYK